MSSSISSSDPPPGGTGPGDEHRFGAWLKTFVGTLVGTCALLYLFLLAIDPFDSGRFPSFPITGVRDRGPRTADASLGRDPRFNAAIFGNSTGQLLQPRRLSGATGLNFVQLTVPGTGPREQLALMHWFIQHHPKTGGMVLVADTTWCGQDPSLPILYPFPFWLYTDSDAEYLAGLFNIHSIEHAVRRIELGLGWLEPSDPAGFCDCGDDERHWRPKQGTDPLDMASVMTATKSELAFPGIERLISLLTEIGNPPPLVIAMPPVFASSLPRAGTPEAMTLASCKARFADLAARRPMTEFVDFRIDDPATRDPDNFKDEIHIRPGLAKTVEDGIAAAMTSVLQKRILSEAEP